ncbi:MAG: hypothetical protein NZ957_05735 [Thaumarchaeota archaeon]|nr:hypothetical protein [Candidatus Calditenuaceae archaeon]
MNQKEYLKIAAAIAGIALLYAGYVAVYLSIADPIRGQWMFALSPWVVALGIAYAYGVVSYRMTQGEEGWKQILGLVVYIMTGWLRHWRLIVALVFITAGLVVITTSQRYYTYTEVTGYRYFLDVKTAPAITGVYPIYGPRTAEVRIYPPGGEALRGEVFLPPIVSGLSTSIGEFVTAAALMEFPVRTHRQIWYLEMGLVTVGLTLIIAGLLFGLYHGIQANNNLLRQCGDHTANYYANLLKLYGYEVPEGYTEALAEFYKTGKLDKLRSLEAK